MRLLSLFAFLFLRTLCASAPDWSVISTENEPSVFIDGKVNAISGRWTPVVEDLVIQGVEPIPVRRTWNEEGRWAMTPSLHVEWDKVGKIHYFTLTESSGATLEYKYTQKKARFNGEDYLCCAPINLSQGYTNTSRGRPSSRTNLYNNRLYVSPKNKTFILRAADGTLRTFELLRGSSQYNLVSEQLPNGNWVLYKYRDRDHSQLAFIRTTNPDQSVTYAQAEFVYKNNCFSIRGSDGQSVEYYDRTGPFTTIKSSTAPDQFLHYNKQKDKILSVQQPLGRKCDIDYYPIYSATVKVHGETVTLSDTEIDNSKPDRAGEETLFLPDPRYGRVKTLSAPTGVDGALLVTHSLLYDPQNRTTTLFDVEDHKTIYQWDQNFRLTEIAHYGKEGTLDRVEQFSWTAQGALLCKSILDANRVPLVATTYAYNCWDDIEEERFYGNLSGSGAPLTLDKSGLPIKNGVEHYSRRYGYSEGTIHLPIHIEEDNGKQIDYTYLPGTDLRQSEEISSPEGPLQATFWDYDKNNLLIRETRKEGTLHFVTEITPKPEAPYQGMPWIIQESYIENGKQKPLRKTILTYRTGGRIAERQIFDADDVYRYSLTYLYNEKGQLIEQTNPLGQVEQATYDVCGNRITHTPYSGRVKTTFTYNRMNMPVIATHRGDDGLIFEERYTYDAKSRLIREEKPFGFWAIYKTDQFGRVASKETPVGVTLYSCNFFGDLQQETDPDGYRRTLRYNAYHKPIQITSPDGGVETFRYGLDGQLQKQIDPEGVESAYQIDCFGRQRSKTSSFQGKELAKESSSYESTQLRTQLDAEGHETNYTYFASGRLSAREFAGEKVEWEYDALGRQVVEQRGELRLVREYDLTDRLLEERREDLQGSPLQRAQYRYTTSGDLASRTSWIEGALSQERWSYDSMRRQTQEIDPLGHVTTTSYQATPLLQETRTDPVGLQVVTGYNPLHQVVLVAITDKLGSLLREERATLDFRGNPLEKTTQIFAPASFICTRWSYDPMGRMVQLTEAAGMPEERSTRYDYTLKGQLRETIKPDGTVLTYSYHPLGPLASLHSSDGTVAYTYTCDRFGRETHATDLRTGQTTEKVYTPHGDLLEETLASGYTLRATHDLRGRRQTLTLPDGSSIQYGHDALYLRSVTRLNSRGAEVYQHRFTNYDQNGELLEEELIGGLGSAQRHYNLVGQLQEIASPYHRHAVDERDPVGNILRAHLDQMHYGYSYNALYELTADGEHTYNYDANFCRIAKDQESTSVNALFELSSLPCDPNGNPTHWDQGRCTFDALDRLTAIEWPDRRVEYAYDGAHRRLSKQLFSKTSSGWQEKQRQYFLYDGANEIGSVDERGEISELRILGRTPQAELGAAVALELHGEVYLPLHDLVGSIRGIVPVKDPSKKVIYEQTPFGEEATAAYTSPWRFSAKRVDAETGLVYYGRRYYAPPLGRWLTTDPAGFTDSLNLYAFVKNNPLLYTDLYGLYTSDNASSLNYDPGPSERVSGASLVAKAFESSSDFVWEVLTSPYLQGSMQVLGGFSEAAIGSSVAMLSPPLGIAMIVHGADQCTAGLRTIYYGAHARTATSQLLELTGLAPGTADLVDGGLSLGGATWGGRLIMNSAFNFQLPPQGNAVNCAIFEEYKATLRAQMEKPYVVDLDLRRLVDRNYKPHANIGSGSTAAAIRYELATGERVFDKLHSQKGRNMVTALEKWLKNNPTATPGDQAAAENLIKDLYNALGE